MTPKVVRGQPKVEDLSGRFEGRLVVVEPLALGHAKGLVDAASWGELFKWMPEAMGDSPELLHAWIERSVRAAKEGREVPFAILDAATGDPVGSTRFLEIRLEHLRAEIGWTWMARRVWGQGHNVETKLLLLGHAFERVGCRRVEFKTDARNLRVRGALLGIGCTFEGIFRKHMVLPDSIRDSAWYSIVDDDWPSVRPMLEEKIARHAA